MSKHFLCKALLKGTQIEFTGPANAGKTLEEQIQEDKKYGIMVPRNGSYFTWKAEDWAGKHITQKQILKGINYAWLQAELEIVLDVRKARLHEVPDFKIAFRATADDPELTSNTLMYHYYPIQDVNHPLRGLCVVNTDFPFTVHGNPISMHEIDPDHYPEHPENFPEHTDPTGFTYDFDQTYTHEGPGHGLGLPHSPNRGDAMFGNYSGMGEFMQTWDKARLVAKYGARPWFKKWFYTRWINWYRGRSDRY